MLRSVHQLPSRIWLQSLLVLRSLFRVPALLLAKGYAYVNLFFISFFFFFFWWGAGGGLGPSLNNARTFLDNLNYLFICLNPLPHDEGTTKKDPAVQSAYNGGGGGGSHSLFTLISDFATTMNGTWFSMQDVGECQPGQTVGVDCYWKVVEMYGKYPAPSSPSLPCCLASLMFLLHYRC